MIQFSAFEASAEKVSVKKSAKTKAPVKKPAAEKIPSAVIKSIDIVGQKKIEKEAIIIRLTSKIGDPFLEKNVAEDIKSIFKMGFFTEIEVTRENGSGGLALEYRVVEKPAVAEIVFEGNSDVKTEDLEAQISIKPFEILNHTKLKESVTKLEKYQNKRHCKMCLIKHIMIRIYQKRIWLNK